MPLIVQKYGGTSVNTQEKREKVLAKIISAKEKGNQVVVVVSAMGRQGEPYATDTLLGLLQEIGPDVQGRTKDLLASCGEIISACIMAHSLEQKGHKACACTGFQAGIKTNENFSNAEIKEINPERIKKALQEGEIVIVAGFQGWTEDLSITTLGRGGSDTTAIALGGALGADLVEIYTDVPGVAFTDPRLIPEAPYIKEIDFTSMHLLARSGSKVVHPRAVKAAINYNIPFKVRSTFSEEEGTLIGKKGESFGGLYGLALWKDIVIVKAKGSGQEGLWQKVAVDGLFCQRQDDEYCLAVQANNDTQGLEENKAMVSANCCLLTALWDEEQGMIWEELEKILQAEGIESKAHFTIPSGGTWAVPEDQAEQALQAIFAYSRSQVQKAG